MPPPRELSKPDAYLKVNGNVYNILQSLQRKKPGSYGYRLAERCLLSEPVVKDNNS